MLKCLYIYLPSKTSLLKGSSQDKVFIYLHMTRYFIVFLFTHSTTPYFTPFAQIPMPHHPYRLSLLSPTHLVMPDKSFPWHTFLTSSLTIKKLPFSFTPSTPHFPTTSATSLFPTLTFIYPINTILLLHLHHTVIHIIPKLPISTLAFISSYTQTHCILHYFYLPNRSHYSRSLPSYTLGDIRSAHPSFQLSSIPHPCHSSFHPLPYFTCSPSCSPLYSFVWFLVPQ